MAARRSVAESPEPVAATRSRSLRLVSLNLAHGRGAGRRHQTLLARSDFERNLDAVAAYLDGIRPDVVALQEVDRVCSWSGRFDHLAYLADRAGFEHRVHGEHVSIGRGPLAPLRYGNAVLSHHPIDLHLTHGFQRRITGKKGYCAASIRLDDRRVDVVSVHLDFVRKRTRRAQVQSMVRTLGVLGEERPLVIAGDFNACSIAEYPLFRELETWRGLHPMPFLFAETRTFPSSRPRHTIDHVWATPDLRFTAYKVHPVRLSDHLPIEVEFEFRPRPMK